MTAHDYTAIQFSTTDHIATLRFNRPEKLNAINRQLASEVCDALEHLGEARVLVVTGSDRAFSAGADLSERTPTNGPSPTLAAYDALAAVAIPAIAAIEGYALGGGLEMAMCCDLRVVSETAQLGQPEVLRGILAGGGGTQRLPRLVGPARAKDLLFTGRHISGTTALDWGLANRVAAPGDALPTALRLARRLATSSAPLVLQEIKAVIDAGMAVPLDAALDLERDRAAFLRTTDDAREGIDAFLERRRPDFRGR